MHLYSFSESSRAFQFVPVAALLSPILIGMAWLSFPSFEQSLSAFELFHLASLYAFLVSLLGMSAFVLEVRTGLRRVNWLWPSILIAGLFFAGACRIVGDFYIARHADKFLF